MREQAVFFKLVLDFETNAAPVSSSFSRAPGNGRPAPRIEDVCPAHLDIERQVRVRAVVHRRFLIVPQSCRVPNIID
jgi:hypothetical protein